MDINSNFLKSRYDIDNFKSGITMVLVFQILSYNFKTSKKVDTIKVYLFRLLEVYLINDLI